MKLRIADDVVFRIIGYEAVIQNIATRVCFSLDRMGTRMWQLMWDYQSSEKVVATLLDEYDVEEETLRRDLDDLIRQLVAKGLVKTETEER